MKKYGILPNGGPSSRGGPLGNRQLRRWLEANPDDDFAGEVRAQLNSEPKRYAMYTREYLGWGVFALMAR
jgi:hypothetical protein